MLAALRISAIAVCALGLAASSANAADLGARNAGARHSRVGAIFADPPSTAPIVIYQQRAPIFVGTALKVPGYYGRPTDFEYRNYYGTSPLAIYERLPYACGFVGLC